MIKKNNKINILKKWMKQLKVVFRENLPKKKKENYLIIMNYHQNYLLIIWQGLQQQIVNKFYIFIIFFNLIADGCSLAKKKSKISILAEELSKDIREYDKFVKEEIDEENYYDEFGYDENDNINYITNDITIINNNQKQFTVYFYFKLNVNNEFNFPIESDLLDVDNQYGYDLIENIINKINNNTINITYNCQKYCVSLKNCENNNKKQFYIDNYELRPCSKKTLKPKFDSPTFSSSILLYNFNDKNISMVCKNNLYIFLIEKFEEEDEIENKDSQYYEEEEEEENEDKDIIDLAIKKHISKFDKDDGSNCKSNCILF